jgi:hypothetical protein
VADEFGPAGASTLAMAAFVAWGRIVFVGPGGTSAGSCLIVGRRPPDLDDVDALARAQLHARRGGGAIRLVEVSPELAELLELAGLGRALGPLGGGSGGQVGREAEGGEEALGIEEGVEDGDSIA